MPPDTPATPAASGSVALHLDGTRERLRLLRRISTTFDDETDLRTQLESVLRQLAEHLDDDAMSLCLAAPSAKRDDLCASFVRKDGGAVETALLRTDRGLGARVRREGLSLRLEDARTDAEVRAHVGARFWCTDSSPAARATAAAAGGCGTSRGDSRARRGLRRVGSRASRGGHQRHRDRGRERLTAPRAHSGRR